jgi:hypothetical protein
MGKKAGIVLFCLVFGLAFGGFGLFALKMAYGTASDWAAARGWVQVPARVLEARLDSHRSKNSATYRVIARYAYRWEGRDYEGTRVGIHGDLSDNVGHWHEEHYRILNAARARGTPVPAWIDPSAPANAVLDRELRWGMALFMLPFATLFPMIGLGAWWMLWKTLRSPNEPEAPALALAPNAERIASTAGPQARMLWFFAIFWNLIAFPIAGLVLTEGFAFDLRLLVLLFPAVGVWLALSAWRASRERRQLGEWHLTLTPRRPALGETLRGHIALEKPLPDEALTVILRCERVDGRGKHTHYHTVWERSVQAQPLGQTLAFSLTPGREAPDSEPKSSQYHRWRVLVQPASGDYERAFDIVVGPAARPFGPSHDDTATSRDAAQHEVPAVAIPATLATVAPGLQGLVVTYAPGRHRRLAAVLGVIAVVFGAVGGLMLGQGSRSVPLPLALVFGGLGTALLLLALRQAHRPLTVTAGRGGISVAESSLFGASEQSAAKQEIVRFAHAVGYSSTTSGRQRNYYSLHAVLRNGRKLTLGDGIDSLAVAEALITRLKAALD